MAPQPAEASTAAPSRGGAPGLGDREAREVLPPGTAVHVRVPASSANLGPGFDSVGLALGIWDECTATVTDRRGLEVDVVGEGAGEVPRDARHLVYRSMLEAWTALGVTPPQGLRLECRNAVPHGRGLGSSATAIVTGIAAAQGLSLAIGSPDARVDLSLTNDLSSRLEGHPDNASASVYGGMTLSWLEEQPSAGATPGRGAGQNEAGPASVTRTVPIPLHPDLEPVVFVPSATLSTAKARSVLPSHVRLADAAANSARAALLVHAARHDPELLLAATREWLHQEPRRQSYPESMDLVDRLRRSGHAAVISGAGPSVLVLATRASAEEVTSFASRPWAAVAPGVPDEGAVVRTVTS